MIGETLERGSSKGGENSAFWDGFNGRILECAVIPLQLAGEPLDHLQRFIMSAATSPQQQQNDQWKAQYHNQVMERAAARKKIADPTAGFSALYGVVGERIPQYGSKNAG
jgi:hypothetical protein